MPYQEYVASQFALQRKAGGAWITVPAATLTYTSDYNPHDHRDDDPPARVSTLIIGSETATVSLSTWDTEGDILFPGDQVRATYAGEQFFLGTVESVTLTAITDPEAIRFGATKRIDVSCDVAGFYAALLTRTVSWESLPEEYWIDRIRRFVVVNGW